MLALTYVGYASAPIVLRFARADVSARIFAACIPVIHALAWAEVLRLWAETDRWTAQRVAAATLALGMGLFAVSAATNTAVFHRTRLDAEGNAKQSLASDIRMPCPAFINTNPVQLLTTEELVTLGTRSLGECAWIQTTTTQPAAGMSVDEFAAMGGVQLDVGQDVYLYVQTARSTMQPAIGPMLAGDFQWAHELMPEADDDLIAGYQRMIYEIPTDIQQTLYSGWSRGRSDSHPIHPTTALVERGHRSSDTRGSDRRDIRLFGERASYFCSATWFYSVRWPDTSRHLEPRAPRYVIATIECALNGPIQALD